jgi:hypothetical protein
VTAIVIDETRVAYIVFPVEIAEGKPVGRAVGERVGKYTGDGTCLLVG